jgi:hypothetical protein
MLSILPPLTKLPVSAGITIYKDVTDDFGLSLTRVFQVTFINSKGDRAFASIFTNGKSQFIERWVSDRLPDGWAIEGIEVTDDVF